MWLIGSVHGALSARLEVKELDDGDHDRATLKRLARTSEMIIYGTKFLGGTCGASRQKFWRAQMALFFSAIRFADRPWTVGSGTKLGE